jgi:hypothetical protein
MKIKTDTAIKVLATYIGQPVIYVGEKELGGQYYPKEKYELAGVREHETPFLLSLVGNYVSADKFKLILKPISSLTDEDCIEVITILQGRKKAEIWFELEGAKAIIGVLANNDSNNWTFFCSNKIYQYLISKGYDLPQYLLDGKTLHESELAIYEN